MKVEISYDLKPIDPLTCMDFIPDDFGGFGDYTVSIDGRECPPGLRDVIMAGMCYQAAITGMTTVQMVDYYLNGKKLFTGA